MFQCGIHHCKSKHKLTKYKQYRQQKNAMQAYVKFKIVVKSWKIQNICKGLKYQKFRNYFIKICSQSLQAQMASC